MNNSSSTLGSDLEQIAKLIARSLDGSWEDDQANETSYVESQTKAIPEKHLIALMSLVSCVPWCAASCILYSGRSLPAALLFFSSNPLWLTKLLLEIAR